VALILCLECGKEVSDKAVSCPNCGAPRKVTRTGAKWEGIGFILIIIGLIMAIAGQGVGMLLLVVGFIVFIIGRFK
jgi:RNA polymerase subunit RPABC4/transcription elongation factor Spt4